LGEAGSACIHVEIIFEHVKANSLATDNNYNNKRKIVKEKGLEQWFLHFFFLGYIM